MEILLTSAVTERSILEYVPLIPLIPAITAVVIAYLAYKQWKRSLSLQQAEYINNLINKRREDSTINDTLYLFYHEENHPRWYDSKPPRNVADVDKTLSYISYILYLRSKKIIEEEEFNLFKYAIHKTLKNKQVVDYLYDLYHNSAELFGEENATIGFIPLFDYGKKESLLGKIFDLDDRETKSRADVMTDYQMRTLVNLIIEIARQVDKKEDLIEKLVAIRDGKTYDTGAKT